jgi:hypothetical protein
MVGIALRRRIREEQEEEKEQEQEQEQEKSQGEGSDDQRLRTRMTKPRSWFSRCVTAAATETPAERLGHHVRHSGVALTMCRREQQSPIPSTAAHQSWARTENCAATTPTAIDRDFVNFYDLDEASLELSKRAVAEAPALTVAQIDLISTLFGFTPVDLDAVPEGQLVGGAALDAHRVDNDLVA